MTVGDCMATNRRTFLAAADGRVQASTVLTGSDQAALLAILSNDTSGVRSLESKLDAETAVVAVVADTGRWSSTIGSSPSAAARWRS
jgi:hypothetical protein